MITVAELVAFPAARARRVAGPADGSIGSVHPLLEAGDQVTHELRELRAAGPLRHGMLVCLSPIEATHWRFDALVAEAAEAGLTAIACRFAGAWDDAYGALADRLGVAVVEVAHPWDAGLAAQRLIGEPHQLAIAHVRAVLAVTRDQERDVAELLRACARRLGRSLRLTDAAGHPMLLDPHAEQTPGSDEGTLRVPVANTTGEPLWLEVAAADASAAERTALQVALDVLAQAVVARLAVRRLVDERLSGELAALLQAVVDASDDLSPDVRARALEAGWRLEGHHDGIRILCDPAADLVALRSVVRDALVRAGLGATVVEQPSGWVAWETYTRPPRPSETATLMERVARAHAHLERHLPSAFGVGTPQPGPAGVGRSLHQAGEAAAMARLRPDAGHVLAYAVLDPAQQLLAGAQDRIAPTTARELLGDLDRHPDVLATLRAYLDHESAVGATAEALGVHRNTVTERVRRAEGLLGVDLTDPDVRLALQLALRTR